MFWNPNFSFFDNIVLLHFYIQVFIAITNEKSTFLPSGNEGKCENERLKHVESKECE